MMHGDVTHRVDILLSRVPSIKAVFCRIRVPSTYSYYHWSRRMG